MSRQLAGPKSEHVHWQCMLHSVQCIKSFEISSLFPVDVVALTIYVTRLYLCNTQNSLNTHGTVYSFATMSFTVSCVYAHP